MRTLLRPVGLILATLLLLGSLSPADDGEDARKEIRKVLDKQAAAWNKGDLDGFMTGYWKSERLSFFSGGNRTEGWDATLERYRTKYQGEGKEMGQLTFSELNIELLGPESAFVRGRFTLVTTKGKPTGLFTLVFKKQRDGWRIVHDHTSTSP
jgi:beta-aspartyl-peptidase (threonine type)